MPIESKSSKEKNRPYLNNRFIICQVVYIDKEHIDVVDVPEDEDINETKQKFVMEWMQKGVYANVVTGPELSRMIGKYKKAMKEKYYKK